MEIPRGIMIMELTHLPMIGWHKYRRDQVQTGKIQNPGIINITLLLVYTYTMTTNSATMRNSISVSRQRSTAELHNSLAIHLVKSESSRVVTKHVCVPWLIRTYLLTRSPISVRKLYTLNGLSGYNASTRSLGISKNSRKRLRLFPSPSQNFTVRHNSQV